MAVTAATANTAAARRLGRFELRQLLGCSARSMAWQVGDPRNQQELVLVLPRDQPADAQALQAWIEQARRAARLTHPNLAHAVEVGVQEQWPYVAYDRGIGPTLAERALERDGPAAADVARWMTQALSGLAFAHDAGVAHHDLQPYLLTLGDGGALRIMGLEVAAAEAWLPAPGQGAGSVSDGLRSTRSAAERDVLALAVVMHGLLANAPALGETDTAAVIERLPPKGREALRLPWNLPRPLPEALRVIVNRATDPQPRQRYRNARTLARALEGWLQADAQQDNDAHAQLIDRVRQIGVLPALPGSGARAARLALMEREHTEELAQVVLRDPALCFELLKSVNSAQVRGTQVAGNGPVLTVRRAIAMVGLDGVRRSALALRDWPGPLDDGSARELRQAIALALRAARVAQSLRPPGYDGEMVSLLALMQNLGRLVVQYHQPEAMRQVRSLMQSAPALWPGEPDEPGMNEQAAAFAVLGTDIDSMGAAVARWWGMDAAVLHMIRRLPAHLPVRSASNDDDLLRAVASAANETVDTLALPVAEQVPMIERIAKRYMRLLGVSPRELQAALQASAAIGESVTDDAVADAA